MKTPSRGWPLLQHTGWSALVAGVCAGLLLTLAQQAWVVPHITEAERFETLRHETGTQGTSNKAHTPIPPSGGGEDPPESAHSWRRTGMRAVGNGILGVGFGLLLVSAMTLRIRHGDSQGIPAGLLWGMAGWTAFSLAPALGLPPQLPGVPQASVGLRQGWWIATAVTTAFGLAVLAFAPTRFKAVGAALLLAPHILEAPSPPLSSIVLPPDLPARFTAAVLATSALFWATLGAIAGWMNQKFRH